jgi:hypothetical protein
VNTAEVEELIFELLKRRFRGCWFYSNKEVETAIRECNSPIYTTTGQRPVKTRE